LLAFVLVFGLMLSPAGLLFADNTSEQAAPETQGTGTIDQDEPAQGVQDEQAAGSELPSDSDQPTLPDEIDKDVAEGVSEEGQLSVQSLRPADAPIPATTATAQSVFIDAEGNPLADDAGNPSPNSRTFKVGETVTVQTTITADGAAWGLTYGVLFYNSILAFDPTTWAQDNPGVPIPTVYTLGDDYDPELFTSPIQSTVRVIIESDGETLVLSEENNYTKVVTLRFKVTHLDTQRQVSVGGTAETTRQRVCLFTDPTLRLADLKRPDTGAFFMVQGFYVPAEDIIPDATKAKTVSASQTSSLRVEVVSHASFGLNCLDASEKKVGDEVAFTVTFGSDTDVYGYAIAFNFPSNAAEPALDLWATDNPGIPEPAGRVPNSANNLLLVFESDGETVVIPAGETLTLTVRFKVTHVPGGWYPRISFGLGLPGVLFVDPSVRAYGEQGLLRGINSTEWQSAFREAEPGGGIQITSNPSGVTMNIVPDTSIVFSQETGVTGANPRPVTVTATITAPPTQVVYGMEAGIVYGGAYLTFDEELTTVANIDRGLVLGYGETIYPTATYDTIKKIYIESDGTTPLIAAGGTLDVLLVFKPTVQGAGRRSITLTTGMTDTRMVLLTDPSVRVKETGEGLTTIDFSHDAIQDAEAAGQVCIMIDITDGMITTTRLLEELTLDYAGYYSISTPEQLQAFADAVNIQGENMIKGNITQNLVLPADFAGIGTSEYPFLGEIKASSPSLTVEVNRTVSGNNLVVGGLVKYLGRGGIVSSLTVTGSIAVTSAAGTLTVGGVAGRSDGGTFAQVTNAASITVSAATGSVGGIVGSSRSTQGLPSAGYPYAFSGCNNTGTVSGGANTGGIVGSWDGTASDEAAANTLYFCTNTGIVSGDASAGGIAGSATEGTVLQSGNGPVGNPLATGVGMVNATGTAAGVVGAATDVVLDNCYNTGTVAGGTVAGGIAGSVTGASTLMGCYSGVGASVAGSANGAGVGGIAGTNNSANTGFIGNFNLSTLEAIGAGSSIGGIAGKAVATPASYRGNYYLAGTATGDALDTATLASGNTKAASVVQESLICLGASIYAPGKYVYHSPEPDVDEDGTYLLDSADDLTWFALKVNANVAPGTDNLLNARLTANIDLSSTAFPGIGAGNPVALRYGGSFDGAGHTITVKFSNTGLFAYCDGATIRDLTIAGSVTSEGSVGAVASGARLTRFENCRNEADVKASSTTAQQRVGGIVGDASACEFIGCVNTGSVTALSTNTIMGVGGIVGYLTALANTAGVLLDGCTNTGTITGGRYAGGLVGYAYCITGYPLVIENSNNAGLITTTSGDNLGGIVGYAASGAAGSAVGSSGILRIEDCTNTGDVIGYATSLGGVIGGAGGSYSVKMMVLGCTISGDIRSLLSNNANVAVGGIVGRTDQMYIPDWGDQATGEVITGNTNTGNVSAVGGGSVSSIVGSGETSAGITINDNSSSVLVGNDRYSPNITYKPPTPPGPGGDPGDGGESGGDPGPGPGPGVPPGSDNSVPTSSTTTSGIATPSVSSVTTSQADQSPSQPVDNRPSQTTQPETQTPTTPEAPAQEPLTASEVVLTPIPLGLGFQTVANTILTLIVGFVTLGIFILGGVIFWRMYRRRIDMK
jgi:hypothetical protein